VFDGSPRELAANPDSATGQYLSGQRGFAVPSHRRKPQRGAIRLTGARGNNLQSIDVEFPLGVLCVVTGVSGSGKSTLVRQTLAPALQAALGAAGDAPLPFDSVEGAGRIDEVAVIDQQALGRISRSNPATYVKAFDDIRRLFAGTPDARAKGLKPGDFGAATSAMGPATSRGFATYATATARSRTYCR
jgi:excinuclease ABC subunit A